MAMLTFPDTSKLILRAAQALYGDTDDWMSAMAQALGVRVDTINDWANARRTPSRLQVDQLHAMLEEHEGKVGTAKAAMKKALDAMCCPVPGCGAALTAIHTSSGQRVLTCAGGHHFASNEGPPYGLFVEKNYDEVRGLLETLWLAAVDVRDFHHFTQHVQNIAQPFEAYQEHLERRKRQWCTGPNRVVDYVQVTPQHLDKYIAAHGACRARELTALAFQVRKGQL